MTQTKRGVHVDAMVAALNLWQQMGEMIFVEKCASRTPRTVTEAIDVADASFREASRRMKHINKEAISLANSISVTRRIR